MGKNRDLVKELEDLPEGCVSFSDTGGIKALTPEETRAYRAYLKNKGGYPIFPLTTILPEGCVSFSDTGRIKALTPEETRAYLTRQERKE